MPMLQDNHYAWSFTPRIVPIRLASTFHLLQLATGMQLPGQHYKLPLEILAHLLHLFPSNLLRIFAGLPPLHWPMPLIPEQSKVEFVLETLTEVVALTQVSLVGKAKLE